MTPKTEKQDIGRRLLAAFADAGAVEVAPDILLPAGALLDLYGEDIRARAYVTADPVRGEMMLRPDFTVPVVQMHMAGGAEPARYCYLGEVFRKQDSGEHRPAVPRDAEYLQCGFELFGRDPAADAEVFALFHRLLAPLRPEAVMGDMSLLVDAVAGLPLAAPRRAALRHDLWRPARFDRLLARFSAPVAPRDPAPTDAPWIGRRTDAAMADRLARLAADAAEPPLDAVWTDRLARLFALDAPAPAALAALRALTAEMPALAPGADRLAARLEALGGRGIDPARLRFAAGHGRATMEYYDGFTFAFADPARPGAPPVASGGRYDALTAQLGGGRAIPAVGGIIRPGMVAEMGGLP